MPWNAPRPQSQWGEVELLRWAQEHWDRAIFGKFAWIPPLVNANSSASFVASATGPDIVTSAPAGLRAGSPVTVSPPAALPSQVSVYAFCAASDQATIVVVNPTGGGVTPPSGNWSLHGTVT